MARLVDPGNEAVEVLDLQAQVRTARVVHLSGHRDSRRIQVPEELDKASARDLKLRPFDFRVREADDPIQVLVLHDPAPEQLQAE